MSVYTSPRQVDHLGCKAILWVVRNQGYVWCEIEHTDGTSYKLDPDDFDLGGGLDDNLYRCPDSTVARKVLPHLDKAILCGE